jgi:hypothetical protein
LGPIQQNHSLYAHYYSDGSAWRNGVLIDGRVFFMLCEPDEPPPLVIGSQLRFASAGWATVLNLGSRKIADQIAWYVEVDKKLDPEADGYPHPIELRQ